MGTSKANIGPKGTPNPIPEWINDNNEGNSSDTESNSDNNQEVNDDNETQINWGDVRRSFTSFTKNPSKSNFKKFASRYRRASGGKKGLSKSAYGGKRGTIILIDFLNSISSEGLEETLKKYQIGDISSLNAEGAINKIAEIFDEIDGTDEGSAASSASIETLNKLYTDYLEEPENIDSIDKDFISEYLEFYISKYIFERISVEITKTLETRGLKPSKVKNIETQLDFFIQAEVKLEFSSKDFSTMNLKEKKLAINKIFEDAYSLI